MAEARRMYQRVLSAWAMDLLRLRRRGLDSPAYRTRQSLNLWPAATAPGVAGPMAA